ncbi:hypothetical protein EDB83DRAFT_648664 [Lactarius deliciosus]|nr:hypothetical protein EDB83DRAFT_648664 [Lactarius deliciosus]
MSNVSRQYSVMSCTRWSRYVSQNQHCARAQRGLPTRCLRGSVLGISPANSHRLSMYTFFWRWSCSCQLAMRILVPFYLPITTDVLSRMPKLFSREQRTRRSRPETPSDLPPAHGTTGPVVSDPVWYIDTCDDIAMGAIQTSLAVLKEGSSLATNLPFIAPIAGLLLQALTMRDEVKQYKAECEIVMGKLARIAGIIVDVCDKYDLSEEDLPTTLRNILSSLQRELDRIERVLKKCSKRKGIRGMLLRMDLSTKIRQCDVELSNVLQAFQAELGLDIRFALIIQRREVGTPTTLAVPKVPNQPIVLPCHFGTLKQTDVITVVVSRDQCCTLFFFDLMVRPIHHPSTYNGPRDRSSPELSSYSETRPD